MDDAIGFAHAAPPPPPVNWRALLLSDSSYDTSKAKSAWPRWVYREMTGLKQARGKTFDAFQAALEEQADWPAATSSGEGLKPAGLKPPRSGVRYYKDAEELLDRLTKLKSARQAGNTSAELRDEAADILDKLLDDKEIDEPLFKGLWEIFK